MSPDNRFSIFDNPEELNNDALLREIDRITDPNFLNTHSMAELFQTTFLNRPPIIEDLLYPGVYILAGAPKIGKSFLVSQIAFHVSTGQKLWDHHIHQATVLYLALEDDFQRIQSRMFRMYGVEDSSDLHFAIAASKIGSGLEKQMENFCQEHANTRLIIIDTMQKVRENTNDSYSYASDYQIIGKLKEFADSHNLCIVTVHHTRKQAANDSFEKISGTNGLLGCADGSLLMEKKKRTSLEATLEITGRDQQDQLLYLVKDPDTQIWNLEKSETELFKAPPDPILESIANLLAESSPQWAGSPSDLVSVLKLDMAPNVLSKHLNVQCGRLLNEYGIQYENKAKHQGRLIRLTYAPEDAKK